MDSLSRETLRALAAEVNGVCVSFYLPMNRATAAQEGPIRLRNLIRTAEERLVARGIRAAEAREILGPAERLAGDSDFWRRPGDGLAAFICGARLHTLRLPLAFDEVVYVGDRTHITPLLPLFTGSGRFFVLALSQNQVRLLQGARDGVSTVMVEGMPTSLAEALKYDEVEKQSQIRSLGGGGGQRGPTVGYGEEVDEKERLLRYFQLVNRPVHDRLREETAPLVLAAVDYLMPIYRDANTYPQLLPEGVVGNPDDASPEDLYMRARAVVTPYFQRAQADAVARYQAQAGTGGTASGVEEVVAAAATGRVDTLLIGVGEHRWGSFDPGTMTVERHASPRPDSVDLLDVAATETLLKGGSVFGVPVEEIPADSALVAVLRY